MVEWHHHGESDAYVIWNYFFFFFMEAISCSAFDSCLAIIETWDKEDILAKNWGDTKRNRIQRKVSEDERIGCSSTSSSFLRSLRSSWALAASPRSNAARCSSPSASNLSHHHVILTFCHPDFCHPDFLLPTLFVILTCLFTNITFVFLPPRKPGWRCYPSWSFPFPPEEVSSRSPKLELKRWTLFVFSLILGRSKNCPPVLLKAWILSSLGHFWLSKAFLSSS